MAYMAMMLLVLALALIALPDTAQAESFSDAERGAQTAYVACAVTSVSTFLIQAVIRGAILQKSRNQETRTKEDNNNRLSDSANRSVGPSEDSQQQAIDTPEEDARKPQKGTQL